MKKRTIQDGNTGVIAAVRGMLSAKGMGQVLSVGGALVMMVIIFSIMNPNFFRGENMSNLLRQTAPILIIGIGQSYVLITGGIDLSIGSVVGMSSMIAATLMVHQEVPVMLAVIITILCCCLAGSINGVLVAKMKMPPFIATLGTMIVCRGIAQLVNGGRNTDGLAASGEGYKNFFYYGRTFGLYNPVWIALVLALLFGFILAKTRTGRYTYAIGSNYEAAKLSGVNVVVSQMIVYIISSFTAAVAGMIFMAQSTMGFMDAGTGYELDAVAASVIGGISTMGGQGILLGTVMGSLVLSILRNGLTFVGAPLAFRNIIIGVVVVFAVLIDRFARRKKA